MNLLRDDLRRLADAFEAVAPPAEVVVARLARRRRNRRLLIPALAAAGAVAVLVVGALIRGLLPVPNAGPPGMPGTTGLFQTEQPDAAGQCFAVRLYDTTSADGRVALWAWTGADGCAARASNLFTGVGTATALALPAAARLPDRTGIHVRAGVGQPGLLAGLEFVLDPDAAPNGGTLPGFRSTDEIAGAPTVDLRRIDALEVPYRVN